MARRTGFLLLVAGLAALGWRYGPDCVSFLQAASEAEFHRPDALLDELGPPYQSISPWSEETFDVPTGSPIERAIAAWVESLRSPRTWRSSLVSVAAPDGIRIRADNFDILLHPQGGAVINLWESQGPDGQYLSSFDITAPEYLALVELLDARCAESSD